MYVPSYQMHNVLKVYSKQLRQNMIPKKSENRCTNPHVNRLKLWSEEKRQATIEKVSKDILAKIGRHGTLKGDRQRLTKHLEAPSIGEKSLHNPQYKTFVFNEVDAKDQKRKNTLFVNDSGFLIQKLEQSVKLADDNKSEFRIGNR